MKALKIGKLIFKKTAIWLILLCLFMDGFVIGGAVAYHQSNAYPANVLLLIFLIFVPWGLCFKSIKKNIEEHK